MPLILIVIQIEIILVVEVKDDTGLLELLDDRDETYDFVMCNPPFFGSNLEAWATYSVRFSISIDLSS